MTPEDAFINAATKQLPAEQVFTLFDAGGALLFVYLTRPSRSQLLHAQVYPKVMLMRACCELIGRFSMSLQFRSRP